MGDYSHVKPRSYVHQLSWGPSMWQFIHVICYNYDILFEGKKKNEYYGNMMTIISTLVYLIPCSHCRKCYASFLKNNKFPISKTFRWSVDLHNMVNSKLGKKIVDCEIAWHRMFTTFHPSFVTLVTNILVPISLVYNDLPSSTKSVHICRLINSCVALNNFIDRTNRVTIDYHEFYNTSVLLSYIQSEWSGMGYEDFNIKMLHHLNL
jgi:hypothetical protein